MLIYPKIDPVLAQIGPLKIHWYGVMYLIGFLAFWLLARYRIKKHNMDWTTEQVSDLIFYGAMGVVIGGRLGHMVFYDFAGWLSRPWAVFEVWKGGMSFHGGLIGYIIAFYLFSKKEKKNFYDIVDFCAPFAPIGLGAGRIGNFINGELWGRATDVSWGMVFPHVDGQVRHPSQLYEFLLEGCLLFIIMWCFTLKPKPRYAASGAFLLLYGCFRFFVEFFREPDAPIGFVAFDWLTMGQLLSLPMIFGGMVMLALAYRRNEKAALKV